MSTRVGHIYLNSEENSEHQNYAKEVREGRRGAPLESLRIMRSELAQDAFGLEAQAASLAKSRPLPWQLEK